MNKTTVVNIRHGKQYDVYIGRPSKWGNPFHLARGTQAREIIIQRYERWLKTQPFLMANIHTLRGKRLGCYCKPLACHGDVLARLANEMV